MKGQGSLINEALTPYFRKHVYVISTYDLQIILEAI